MATAAKQQTGVRRSSVPSSSTKISSSTKSITTSTSIISGRSPTPTTQKSSFIETEEDIATIAKQISDHAEAIYQTWKARGLAPTEILNCHTGTSKAFGEALTPPNRNSLESPVAEILAQAPDMSNNNLEKLVSSFVNEDKARQQASKKYSNSSILTSGTIKNALRKFESSSMPCGYVKPNYLVKNAATSKCTYSKTASTLSGTSSDSNKISNTKTTNENTTASTSPSNQLSKSVPDVLIDTINQAKNQMPKSNASRSINVQQTSSSSIIASSSVVASLSSIDSASGSSNCISSNRNCSSISATDLKKPQTPAKPANLLNRTPSWPLKNRLGLGGGGNILCDSATSCIGSVIKNEHRSRDMSDNSAMIRTTETEKKSADLLDEVSREEERLINALKTGVVLNSNDKLPEVITSTLNDKIDRTSSWVKPDTSTTASILTASTVGAKSASKVSQVIRKSSKTTSPEGNIIRTWNDEQGKSIISSAFSQPTKSSTMTSNNAASVVTTVVNQNIQKVAEIIAPTPTPTKMRLRPKSDAAVPHPETKNSNSHNNLMNTRINAINPVRPFLTRGSVAERVLMFEKCPDVKVPLRNINREPTKITCTLLKWPNAEIVFPLFDLRARDYQEKFLVRPLETKPLIKPEQQTHTTLQRHIRSSSKNVYIPRFYFPHGKPLPTITVETTLQQLVSAFDSFPNNQVTKEDLPHILKMCGLPFYWRMPIISCTQHATSGLVDGYRFIEFWKQMSVYCHDEASRFVYILCRGQRSRSYILHEDLAPLVQDVVDTHPGLAFLKEATEFHSRYVHTIIARIFYSVNRSWSGKITVPELRRSNLLQVIQLLEEEDDINQIMAFFSYEHFYVIYCKFWELDRDHDLFIDQNDLARHNDHALSTRIIERIFSGCVTRGGRNRISGPNGPQMSYTDFVWFLLSEEDKTNPTAIEYWFRCMDLDGDGILSMYELEYFYEEQQQRMEAIGIETLPFEDCLCQMLDMVKPVKPGCITLGDLKKCRMTPIFYDTFFNLEKYLEHEQRDPFATQRESDDGLTDWDRYAAQEYELLVAEEGGDTQGSYDEDDEYESNIDILESQLDDMSNMINEW